MPLNLFQAHIARRGGFSLGEAQVFFKVRYRHQQRQKPPGSKVKMAIRSLRFPKEFEFGVRLASLRT